jgi:hypothetical protein
VIFLSSNSASKATSRFRSRWRKCMDFGISPYLGDSLRSVIIPGDTRDL